MHSNSGSLVVGMTEVSADTGYLHYVHNTTFIQQLHSFFPPPIYLTKHHTNIFAISHCKGWGVTKYPSPSSPYTYGRGSGQSEPM